MEFKKRIDPDLPFYYYTSAHDRFYEDYMPDFSQMSSHPRQPRRTPRRELLGVYVGRRVTLVQRGATSLRASFHNVPIDLTPPPSQMQFLLEHAYASN